jgi:hypothetical protein
LGIKFNFGNFWAQIHVHQRIFEGINIFMIWRRLANVLFYCAFVLSFVDITGKEHKKAERLHYNMMFTFNLYEEFEVFLSNL